MKGGEYKKHSELAAWDLDKGCRNIINQSSRKNRKLKKKIRRADRKRLDKSVDIEYNIDTEKEGSAQDGT